MNDDEWRLLRWWWIWCHEVVGFVPLVNDMSKAHGERGGDEMTKQKYICVWCNSVHELYWFCLIVGTSTSISTTELLFTFEVNWWGGDQSTNSSVELLLNKNQQAWLWSKILWCFAFIVMSKYKYYFTGAASSLAVLPLISLLNAQESLLFCNSRIQMLVSLEMPIVSVVLFQVSLLSPVMDH
jgi:hypothetical protein